MSEGWAQEKPPSLVPDDDEDEDEPPDDEDDEDVPPDDELDVLAPLDDEVPPEDELLVVPTTEGAAFSSSQAESADTLPAQEPSNRTTWRGESEVMPQVVLQGCRAR